MAQPRFATKENNSATEQNDSSLQSSLIVDTAKSLVGHTIEDFVNNYMPGIGTYFLKKIEQTEMVIDILERRENAIHAGRSESNALVCSIVGTASETVVKTIGNLALTGGIIGYTRINPLGLKGYSLIASAIAFIESGSNDAGNLAENFCHYAFDKYYQYNDQNNDIHHIPTRHREHQFSFSIKPPATGLYTEMQNSPLTTDVSHQNVVKNSSDHFIDKTKEEINTTPAPAPTPTITPRIYINLNDLKNSTVGFDIALNSQASLQMGLRTTINQPLKNLQPSISQTIGNSNIGASTSLKRPLKDIRPIFSHNSGFFASTSLKNPTKDIVVGIPIVPGIAGFNIPLRKPSAACINIGPVNFSVKRAICDVRNGIRKVLGRKKRHKEEPTVGPTGLPWFEPDFNRGGGTEKLEPNAVNGRLWEVKNKFNALYADLTKIQKEHRYTETLLPFILKVSELENAIKNNRSASIDDQVNLAVSVSKYIEENSEKFTAWADFSSSLNEHYNKSIDLYNEVSAEVGFFSYVLHAYDFSYYPWPRRVYFEHYHGFFDLLKNISAYIYFVKDVNGYEGYTNQLSDLINYYEILPVGSTGLPWFVPDFNRGGGTEKLEPNAVNRRLCEVKNKFNAIYVELLNIQNKHQYTETLLPFILKISELEKAIQNSKNASIADQVKLAVEVSNFIEENNDKFAAWADFCSALNKHYNKSIDLHNEVSAEAHFLSYVLDAYDFSRSSSHKQIYFEHYQGFVCLLNNISTYIDFVKDANGYVGYTYQLSNLINYCDTLPGIHLAAISDEFNKAKSLLKNIYNQHDYEGTLLPFILKVKNIEADIEVHLATHQSGNINQTVEDFIQDNEANLEKWIQFYSEFILYVTTVESLMTKTGAIIENLSNYINDPEKHDANLKGFYSNCYHHFNLLYQNIYNLVIVAQNGCDVFNNQARLSNVINYHEVVAKQDNTIRRGPLL